MSGVHGSVRNGRYWSGANKRHGVDDGIAFVLSLCSSADAFVAASFSHSFLPGSILGFLVFGPMLDLKNVLIMMSCFKRSFVVTYVLLIFAVVFSLCLIAGGLISKGLLMKRFLSKDLKDCCCWDWVS
ncbi:permease [[Brevibacterium] frigoritolerans]|uniref:Permease n=1 Tax=Peribacillus frigoritolerans TaxID=450367 RepID=A0A941J9T3_9BACI|nr:permease [Peribacillus frigoritolerans]